MFVSLFGIVGLGAENFAKIELLTLFPADDFCQGLKADALFEVFLTNGQRIGNTPDPGNFLTDPFVT